MNASNERYMYETDQQFYRRRAEMELDLAQKARLPEVVSAHYRLAEAYLARLQQVGEIDPSGEPGALHMKAPSRNI